MILSDQGRDRDYDDSGTPEGGAIGGLIFAVLVLAALFGAWLFIAGHK